MVGLSQIKIMAMLFPFFVVLGNNGTHQLTNKNDLIWILENNQLTHELLRGCDDYQDLLKHLDEMDWMKLMDRKREKTLEWWNHQVHLVLSVHARSNLHMMGMDLVSLT